MPSCWLIDLMASSQRSKNLTASFHINNALDKKYYPLMNIYDVYSCGEPRSVSVSMRYDFCHRAG